MTFWSYFFIVIGAATVSIKAMELIDLMDRPKKRTPARGQSRRRSAV